MPEAVTLYTSDKYWRVEIEAWTADLRVYRSIGTRVAVYHEEPVTTIWGSRPTDWEQEPAARACKVTFAGEIATTTVAEKAMLVSPRNGPTQVSTVLRSKIESMPPLP